MPTREDIQHDLLLSIAIALSILFATGLAGPPRVSAGEPIVFP